MIITISIRGQGSPALSLFIFAILGTNTERRRGIFAHTMMLESVIGAQLCHVSVEIARGAIRCIRRPDLIEVKTVTWVVLVQAPSQMIRTAACSSEVKYQRSKVHTWMSSQGSLPVVACPRQDLAGSCFSAVYINFTTPPFVPDFPFPIRVQGHYAYQ